MSTPQNDLLDTLFVELFQTERSAIAHPEREAERYGEAAPGVALRAVSAHARAQLPGLERLAQLDDHRMAKVGLALGEAFSVIRQAFGDRLVSREKSYRGTLLGMHHGIDVVLEVDAVARILGKDDIVAWCSQWLAVRRPLVEQARSALVWFAENPELAGSRPGLGGDVNEGATSS